MIVKDLVGLEDVVVRVVSEQQAVGCRLGVCGWRTWPEMVNERGERGRCAGRHVSGWYGERGLLEEGSGVEGLARDEASEHCRCRTGSRKAPRDHPPAGCAVHVKIWPHSREFVQTQGRETCMTWREMRFKQRGRGCSAGERGMMQRGSEGRVRGVVR